MDVGTPVASIYPRGPCFYLRWRENDHPYRRSLGKITRAEAEAIQAQKEAELRGVSTPQSGTTCGVLLDGYLVWYKKARPTTYKRAVSALKPFKKSFGGVPAEGLNPRQVEMWEVSAEARAHAHKALVLTKAAYRRAMRLGEIQKNPMERVKMTAPPVSRAPDYFKPPQLGLLGAAPRGALWTFMAHTGIRRGEMIKARRDDVRDGLIYIESVITGRTKSGKWRSVPLNKEALKALESLGDDRLVTCEHPDTLSDWFDEDAAEVGVKGTLHWLRHTFCTALVQSGVSLNDVKILAGHSSITVTEKYAHHAPTQGKRAVDLLGAWARPKPKKRHRRSTVKHSKVQVANK